MGEMVELLAGERQKSETSRAIQACNDWLRMGPGRSLAALHEKYSAMQENAAPTQSRDTLNAWSSRFGWSERATTFDANWERIKDEERRAELGHGLALEYERVRKLKELAEFLWGQIDEQDAKGVHYNVWVPDVKVVGHGDSAEVVDIERFNAALIREYRETLADIAAEVGGRVKKADLTSDGKPLTLAVIKMDVDEL